MSESLLFLTGHLAYDNLCRELELLSPTSFTYRVENIQVKVAALMTNNIILRRLKNLDNIDRVVLPGLHSGDLDILSEQFNIPFVRGPKDLRDLPEFLGGKNRSEKLTEHAVCIFSEIVDAPKMSVESIVELASEHRIDGADVIDIGCLPNTDFPHLEETVSTLKQEGFMVSIDSKSSDELLAGANSGADYLLSLSDSTAWIADEVNAIPILIPKSSDDPESLYRAIEKLSNSGKPFYADPLLEPFPYGFTDSIVRYHSLRARYPQCQILMGTGNVTELIDADTSGITAILMSIITELDIGAILTTQVSQHACRVIRESELARRVMFAAGRDRSLPRRYDAGLMTIHDKKPFPYTSEEIAALAQAVSDPSYRIQVGEDGIHLFNRDGMSIESDPFKLLPYINVNNDSSHMFYLGVELARAQIAWQLGKRYLQDNEIDWGVAGRMRRE